MATNEQIIKNIEQQHLYHEIPSHLKAYLHDRYDEEPLLHCLSDDDIFSIMRDDIEKYYKGNLDISIRTETERMQDEIDELRHELACELHSSRIVNDEVNRLEDFIHHNGLEHRYHRYIEEKAGTGYVFNEIRLD